MKNLSPTYSKSNSNILHQNYLSYNPKCKLEQYIPFQKSWTKINQKTQINQKQQHKFSKQKISQKQIQFSKLSLDDLKKSIYPGSDQPYLLNKNNQQISQNNLNSIFNLQLNNLMKIDGKKGRFSLNNSTMQTNCSLQFLKNSIPYDKLNESSENKFINNENKKQLFQKINKTNNLNAKSWKLEDKENLYKEKMNKNLENMSKQKYKRLSLSHTRYPSSYGHLNKKKKYVSTQSSYEIGKNKGLQEKIQQQKFSSVGKLSFTQSQVDIAVSSEEEIQQQMTARFNFDQENKLSSIAQFNSSQLQSSVTSLGQRVVNKKQQKIVLKQFILGPCKGKGRYGKVYMAINKKTGVIVALKQIQIETIQKMMKQFIWELKIQSFLNHPYITKIFGFFVQKDKFYIIMEYMNEGNLYQLVKREGCLTEMESATKIYEISKALCNMHQYNIIHRDLKPQNVVIGFNVCKLCDFSWATRCIQRRQTNCGTLDYLSPQIIEGNMYNNSIDLWSVGVLLYEMLVGKPPFYNVSVKQTVKKIKQCDFKFPLSISQNSRNVIECLLRKDPSQRKQIEQILRLPFFKQVLQ